MTHTTPGLSRMQLSRVVVCCDALFFKQHRFGPKLRVPYQEPVKVYRSSSMPLQQLNQAIDGDNSPASGTKKGKKKKKNLLHFFQKKVFRSSSKRKSKDAKMMEILEIGILPVSSIWV